MGSTTVFNRKDNGFLAFFLLIVVGTVIIDSIVNYVVSAAKAQGGPPIFFLSAIAVLAVLAESEWGFAGGS